jgi:hypothetical protein
LVYCMVAKQIGGVEFVDMLTEVKLSSFPLYVVLLVQLTSVSFCRSEDLDGLVDPVFMSMTRDPDQRRKEQWERAVQSQAGWGLSKWVGLGGLGAPPLSFAEEDTLHARFLARANAISLTEVAEMKIM